MCKAPGIMLYRFQIFLQNTIISMLPNFNLAAILPIQSTIVQVISVIQIRASETSSEQNHLESFSLKKQKTFLDQYQTQRIMQKQYREFPYILYTVSPTINILCQYGTFIISRGIYEYIIFSNIHALFSLPQLSPNRLLLFQDPIQNSTYTFCSHHLQFLKHKLLKPRHS